MKPKRKIISLTLLLLTALLYIVSLLCSFSGYFSPEQGAAWMLLGLATPAVLALDAAVLAAMNIADQYLKEQEASENLRRQVKENLEEASALKLELSEAKREIFKLGTKK